MTKRVLTLHQANLIRKLRADKPKKYTHKYLANLFLVSKATIKEILYYRTYKDEMEGNQKLCSHEIEAIKTVVRTYPKNKKGRGKLMKAIAEKKGVSYSLIRKLIR